MKSRNYHYGQVERVPSQASQSERGLVNSSETYAVGDIKFVATTNLWVSVSGSVVVCTKLGFIWIIWFYAFPFQIPFIFYELEGGLDLETFSNIHGGDFADYET